MNAHKFVALFLGINLTIVGVIGAANFIIDGDSSRHLPGDASFFPRTTNHSALSKLHYLYRQRPEVLFFGSSRVEVGLPVPAGLFRNRSVYNAGLSANTLGNTLPLATHVLGGYTPKVIVLGIDFMSFTPKPSPLSNLEMWLLSPNFSEYRIKRLGYDLKRAVTVDTSQHSLTSLRAMLHHRPFDPIDGAGSIAGQTSEKEMLRLTATRGQYVTAFRRTLQYAAGAPPSSAEIAGGLRIFEDFVANACERHITLRVFTNPRHALAEYQLVKQGRWDEVEQWKVQLAGIASRHQPQCDLQIVDFSGFNSITTEPIGALSPSAGLANFWEASHFKDNVGTLILRRLFDPHAEAPVDFGLPLTRDSVGVVNAKVDAARKAYGVAHAAELEAAEQWINGPKL